jgi:hypothetical protein
MNWKEESKKPAVITAGFLLFFYLPVGRPRFDNAVGKALQLVKWYAREYVLLCLVPAIRSVRLIWTNFFASVFGAFMYIATLTEVPIVQGLIGSGMGKGPALALLLSGPSLSLPSVLVIRSVLGTQKTVVYVSLVIVMSTIAGMIFGVLF